MDNQSSVTKRLPAPELGTLVEEYVYRKILIEKDNPIIKNMPCRHVNSLDFFLKGSYDTFAFESQKNIPFSRCTIRGPRTYKKYRITIKEDFESFSIRFKPTGIYQLLGLPMPEFCNESIDATLVLPNLFTELTDRMLNCNDVQKCIDTIEPYLLKQLKKDFSASDAVAKLAISLTQENTSRHLSDHYKDIPLSSRQLERNFVKEVGVSPKTFSRIIRFEKVVQERINQPKETWVSLTYKNNYFDQMHLVKDFKQFLGTTPTAFRPNDFAF